MEKINPTAFQHYFQLTSINKKFQKSNVWLKLRGIRQPLAYADDMNLLRDNVGIIKKNKNFN
jgi:hypothetical protein